MFVCLHSKTHVLQEERKMGQIASTSFIQTKTKQKSTFFALIKAWSTPKWLWVLVCRHFIAKKTSKSVLAYARLFFKFAAKFPRQWNIVTFDVKSRFERTTLYRSHFAKASKQPKILKYFWKLWDIFLYRVHQDVGEII